jgi:hypothetical protein
VGSTILREHAAPVGDPAPSKVEEGGRVYRAAYIAFALGWAVVLLGSYLPVARGDDDGSPADDLAS